jgi:hypothetical protein
VAFGQQSRSFDVIYCRSDDCRAILLAKGGGLICDDVREFACRPSFFPSKSLARITDLPDNTGGRFFSGPA